jgi:hypothetical protein
MSQEYEGNAMEMGVVMMVVQEIMGLNSEDDKIRIKGCGRWRESRGKCW